MLSSRSRPPETEEDMRKRIRSRIETLYNQQPGFYDRLARKYGTKANHSSWKKPMGIQAEHLAFIRELSESIEFAVTLTPKDSPLSLGYFNARSVWEKTLRHYGNRLNKAAYGHGMRRRSQTLTLIVVIEGDSTSGKRLHAHLGVSRPEHIDSNTWMASLLREARRCLLVNRQIEVKAVTSSGWADYLAKEGIEALALDATRRGSS